MDYEQADAMLPSDKVMFSVRELASMFGVQQRTVWKWRRRGLIRACQPTPKSVLMFPRSEVARFIVESMEPPPPEPPPRGKARPSRIAVPHDAAPATEQTMPLAAVRSSMS